VHVPAPLQQSRRRGDGDVRVTLVSASAKSRTRARFEGLAILLVAGGYLWEAHNVPDLFQMPGVPGPTTFPYLLGIIFALAGLWLFISPADLLARRRQPAAEERAEKPPAPAASLWARLAAQWHFYAMWIAILGYLALMPSVGFPVATFVLLVVFTFLLGEERWWLVGSLALVVTAVIHLGFGKGLNVRLPLGVLESLLK
jgi:hypothetical protein